MSYRYYECRVLGHSWESHITKWNVREYFEVLHCTRCKLRRLDISSMRTGAVLKRTYSYPSDYHRAGRKVTRQEDRLSLILERKQGAKNEHF